MNITQLAFNNGRLTFSLLIIICLLGIASYPQMARDSMPDFTIRTASIVTAFPGASSERVETLVSKKIEQIVQSLAAVKFITSESRSGLSVVQVTLKDSVKAQSLRSVWDSMRRKVDEIDDLPEGSHKPIINDEDIGTVYGIMVGLISDGYSYREIDHYTGQLKDRLIALEDAATVEISGINDERIYITYDDAELAQYGLSGAQLETAINNSNIIIPAGEVRLGEERITLEPSGNLKTLEDLENTLISVGSSGKTVRLRDITEISRGYVKPQPVIVKVNGQLAVALSVSLKADANIVSLGEQINKTLQDWNQQAPHGLQAQRIASQDIDVEHNVDNFVNNVIQSIVIVLLVMLVFLGIRTGLIVSSLIPLAILATLFFMDLLSLSLNQVTLAALIIALGMLVDNAIVISEAMMVKIEKGIPPSEAALESSRELIIPLLISSLTTAAAFLAFFLAESTMGEIMGNLFIVVSLALLCSWVLSLTIIPLITVFFFKSVSKSSKSKKSHSRWDLFSILNREYLTLLNHALKRPFLVLIIIGVLFIVSIQSFSRLPFIFFPDSERNLVTLDLNLPLGTDIEVTEHHIGQLERFIKQSLLVNERRSKGVTDWSSFIGSGPESYDLGYQPNEANSGYAHMLINTSSGQDNQNVIDQLEHYAFNHFPNAEVKVKRLTNGGGAAVPIEIRIQGDNLNQLSNIARTVKVQLRQTEGTKNIDDNWGPKVKQLFIDIDAQRAGQAGISNRDIAVSLNAYFSGQNVGDFRSGNDTIGIYLQAEESIDFAYSDLESVHIFSQSSGQSVPLSQVAHVIPQWQYAKILHRDLVRSITIESHLIEGYTASEVLQSMSGWLDEQQKTWPNGFHYELGGEAESSSDAMTAVVEKLPLSFAIILLLLVLQFKAYRKTTIVLCTIPLGLIGVIWGLLLMNSFFSFTGFLGVISLAGILINNAIVLLDRINVELERLNDGTQAVYAACKERFRPILLTTFTTSFGLIPLWIGGGLMWQPMAIAIIFGLLFGTIITLIFVPVLYKLLYRL